MSGLVCSSSDRSVLFFAAFDSWFVIRNIRTIYPPYYTFTARYAIKKNRNWETGKTGIGLVSEHGINKKYTINIAINDIINNRIIYLFISFPRSKLKPPRIHVSMFPCFSPSKIFKNHLLRRFSVTIYQIPVIFRLDIRNLSIREILAIVRIVFLYGFSPTFTELKKALHVEKIFSR